MMESLRSATRNTGFERWLDATLRPQPQADLPAAQPGDSPKVHFVNGVTPLCKCVTKDRGLHSWHFALRSFIAMRIWVYAQTTNIWHEAPLLMLSACAPSLSPCVRRAGRRQQPAGQPPWQ